MGTISKKPRIVIYGVGQYGGYLTRFAVKKGWTIVAAFNRSGPKVGQDLGQVVGLDKDLGVVIQDCDTASYDTLDADIGLVAQTNLLKLNFVAYERLMNAGLNVGCHGSESYFPSANDPECAKKIDELAKTNGVTFTGSGIWDMSRLWAGVLVAGPCTELSSLFHTSITRADGQAETHEQGLQIGIGQTVDVFHERKLGDNPIAFSYKSIPEQVLHALGYTITQTRVTAEPVVFDVPVKNPWRAGEMFEAGLCVGTRIVGEIETKEGVGARAEIELRLFKEGEIEHMFWEANGIPKTRIRTEREDSAHATAACLFNRVPDIIAAAPGIRLVTDMGPLKTTAVI